jgi:O-antigen/teichoic acid export membrane protein
MARALNHAGALRTTRWAQWAKRLAFTGLAQLIVEAIGFVAGVLVIRTLDPYQYGLYTLGNAMLGTMTLLADSGIAAGVMAQAGRVWQDRQRLGAVLATGMDLRRKFAVVSAAVSIPVLVALLRHHDADWVAVGAIVGSLIVAFAATLSSAVLEIAPKLRQNIAALQRIRLASSGGRLMLLTSTLLVPHAALAILCAGLSQLWANWRLRSLSERYAEVKQAPDMDVRGRILSVVRRSLPVTVYYCVSGQVTIWLISLFGSTAAVAQVGALSRLAVALNVLTTIVSMLVIPRFVRLPGEPKRLIRRYLQVLGGLTLGSAIIVLAASTFPERILYVLGDDYSVLTLEVVLAIAGGCLGVITAAAYLMCAQRGHVMRPSIAIAGYVTPLLLMILFLDYSSVRGVLLYGLASHAIQLALWVGYFILVVTRPLKANNQSMGSSL